MNITPISATVTGLDGSPSTTWLYYPIGKREVWVLAGLHGRALRRELRRAGFDKRQVRRLLRRLGREERVA